MSDVSEIYSRESAKSIMPLYHGPYVKIQINPSGDEYTVSKPLLCRESVYFSTMFEGGFSEGHQQTAVLEEMEGVISTRSLEALFQWLYLRSVKLDAEEPEDQISAAIEFARLADMCNMAEVEPQMAQYIKDILIANPKPRASQHMKPFDINTHKLTAQHIISATCLPQGHAVRRILAAASVEGYLRHETFKFAQETQEYPSIGADLLQEVRKTLNGLSFAKFGTTFEDPISGKRMKLNRPRNSWISHVA